MPEFILIPYDVDENHLNTFTDVKPVGKGISTFGRFTLDFLRTTFKLTVFPLPVKVSTDYDVAVS